MRPACHLGTQDTVFDSLDTRMFRSEFAADDNLGDNQINFHTL